MRKRFSGSMITVAVAAAAISAVISVSVTRTAGQTTRPARVGGKPNLTGSPSHPTTYISEVIIKTLRPAT